MTTRTKTKSNPDQLAFNFTPVRPGFPICAPVRPGFPICETVEEIGATLAAFGINGKSKTPTVTLAGPKVTPQVPALAGMTPLGVRDLPRTSAELGGAVSVRNDRTNATFESSPGSTHRVILHREYREGHRLYRSIQFPGATYSDGSPRIQTVNGGCVTPDPF